MSAGLSGWEDSEIYLLGHRPQTGGPLATCAQHVFYVCYPELFSFKFELTINILKCDVFGQIFPIF